MAGDLAAMRELPPDRFEACRVVPTQASSLSLVRFDANDYSVPVCHAHREVVAKGDCERVAIWREGERIGLHRRIWSKEQVCFDPVH